MTTTRMLNVGVAITAAAIVVGGLVNLRTGTTAPTARPAPQYAPVILGKDSQKFEPLCTVGCPPPLTKEERAKLDENYEQWKRDHDAYLVKNGFPPKFSKQPAPPPVVKPRIVPRPSWDWRQT